MDTTLLKKIGLSGLLAVILSLSILGNNERLSEGENLFYSKGMKHDTGYNLVSSSTSGKKLVDPIEGKNYGYTINKPDNTNITDKLIELFKFANDRDKKVSEVGLQISPLLYLGHENACSDYTSKFRKYAYGINFMTTREEFLSIQNGGNQSGKLTIIGNGYIERVRDLVAVVHRDLPQDRCKDFYFGLIKDGAKPKYGGFITYGPIGLANICSQVVSEAMKQSRYWKYRFNRIRPEELAGLFEFRNTLTGEIRNRVDKEYDYFTSNSEVQKSKVKYGNYLLPQSYPEGSPTHPDYPQGHSTFAVVVGEFIKSTFNTGDLIPNRIVVNGELVTSGTITIDKAVDLFIKNISIGRAYAGVHFVDAGTESIKPITELSKKRFKQLLP